MKIENLKKQIVDSFVCKGCKHELPIEYQMRTIGYCYLCDPNITIQELLSDKQITNNPQKKV
jgi:uncharacterized protein YlaI